MKRRLYEKRPSTRGSVLLSIGIHILVIIAIASITFHYPISAFLGLTRDTSPAERIQYVKVAPPKAQVVGNGAQPRTKAAARRPAPLFAPVTIPSALPSIAAPTVSAGAISGKPGGVGGAPVGLATGVEPALPDPRLELEVGKYSFPKTNGQLADSAVHAIYESYRAALLEAEAHPQRNPKDWTIERNGQKYGLDSQYIYLGKFKLPSAILAALPFNTGGVDGSRILQARSADWIRRDIMEHSQGLSEDDFRAAVRRIRERKDKERKEADDQKKKEKPVIIASPPEEQP